MAGSRVEKIGTIFSRVTSLIRSGARKWDDRPLWFDVYSAFPPKQDPRFDRQPEETQMRKLIYPDDVIRAQYLKEIPYRTMIDLTADELSKLDLFVSKYKERFANSPENSDPRELFRTLIEEEKEANRKKGDLKFSDLNI